MMQLNALSFNWAYGRSPNMEWIYRLLRAAWGNWKQDRAERRLNERLSFLQRLARKIKTTPNARDNGSDLKKFHRILRFTPRK